MLNERENMPLPEEGKPLDNFTHLGNTIAFTVNNFHKRGGVSAYRDFARSGRYAALSIGNCCTGRNGRNPK